MKVRRAVASDAMTLAALRYDFRAGMNGAVEDREEFIERCGSWMEARLGSEETWACWVVEDDAGIAGQLWLEIIEKIPNPASELEVHAYITNVYVGPRARGAGAGEALVQAALAYCREHRADSVILWPTERSRTLYARHGFAAPDDMLELVLDEGRDLH